MGDWQGVLSTIADILGIIGFGITLGLLWFGKRIQDKVNDLYASNVALPNAHARLTVLLEELRRHARNYPNAGRDIDEALSRLKGNLTQLSTFLQKRDRDASEGMVRSITQYLTTPHGKNEEATWAIVNQGWELSEALVIIIGRGRW